MLAIPHCRGLGECLPTFLLTLVFYIYFIVIYILAPMFVATLPQPWRTIVALSWDLCQPLFCLGVCLLFPHTSLTWTTLVVESVMVVSYTCGTIFAYSSTGLTSKSYHTQSKNFLIPLLVGSITIIGAIVFGVVVYVTIIDPLFRSTFVRHGQHQFLAQLSALDRLRFLFQDIPQGLRIVFARLSICFVAWMGKDGEAVTEGNALDVVSSPQGHTVCDIPPPYSVSKPFHPVMLSSMLTWPIVT
jgi:hypothetical protein